jgi:DNA-directed RNA polymerase subunit RPC12/RpoP
MKGWKCGNCGHNHEVEDEYSLAELGFTWELNGAASKTRCANCGSYTLQRPYTWDEWGIPIAGYFLVVKSYNRIRRGK